jgi:hypothetical protein
VYVVVTVVGRGAVRVVSEITEMGKSYTIVSGLQVVVPSASGRSCQRSSL